MKSSFSALLGQSLVLLVLFDFGLQAAAAQPVQIPLFKPGRVADVVIAPDGGLISVGDFSFVDAAPVQRMVKLRSDGSLDPGWSHRFDGSPIRLAEDRADGSLLVMGRFVSVADQPRNGMARFSPSGALLPWAPEFPGGAGASIVLDADVLPSGDIIAILVQDGQQGQTIFRIDGSSGSASALWDVEGSATHISTLPDGSVVVAGSITAVGGVAISAVARLSGPALSPANLFVSPPTSVSALDRDAIDGSWYVASGNALMRFGPTGLVDATWSVVTDGAVARVLVDGDRGVLVGGSFTRVAGVERSRVARVRKDAAALDESWAPPVIRGSAVALAATADHVAVGGNLVSAGSGQAGLVVLSGVGGTPAAPALRRRFGTPSDSRQPTHRVVGLADGGVIVTGPFTHTTDAVLPGIMRIDANGTPRRDWAPQIGGLIDRVALGEDGFVYLSGLVARGGELTRSQIIRVELATGLVDGTWSVPASFSAEHSFALAGDFAYTFRPSASSPGNFVVTRWLLANAIVDPAWQAPVNFIANYRDLSPPRADGSLTFAIWELCCVDFDPPPPPGNGRPLVRVTSPGAATDEGFGPVFDRTSVVSRVRSDAQGRTYVSGHLRLDGQSDRIFPRLLPDGSLDTAFQFRAQRQWVDGPMAISPDGDWLYSTLAELTDEGWTSYRVVRFETDTGTIDRDWSQPSVAGWLPADIAIAGNRIFLVTDWWSVNAGMSMMTAAFLDPAVTPLMRDGFEPSPPSM